MKNGLLDLIPESCSMTNDIWIRPLGIPFIQLNSYQLLVK